MPWCPKCRCEYQKGFMTCTDCDTDLVDELTQVDIDTEYDAGAYLVSAANSIEAEMIEALLNSNQIPVLKKFKEAGAYLDIYMGSTNLGVDLYVPSKLREKAKEIIESDHGIAAETEQQNPDEDTAELCEKYNKKRRIRTWIILLFFIPGLIWIIIEYLYTLYRWILG